MNLLEFFASIIGSLAWPVSAAVIALIFRSQIKALFGRLEELGYGEWKLKLAKDLEEAEEAAEALPPPPEVNQENASPSNYLSPDKFGQLVAISPNAAILDEWLEIEKRLYHMAEILDVSPERAPNAVRIIDALKKNPDFPSSLVSLLSEMRQIRNFAAHSSKVSMDDAYRFKKLSDRVKPFLATVPFG